MSASKSQGTARLGDVTGSRDPCKQSGQVCDDSYLRSDGGTATAYPVELIGQSPAILECIEKLLLVAATDLPVLLHGETGTGKEVFARKLAELSRRAVGPFIAVNCAGLPESLVESELFGYEKGAFTGANGRKPGRFELANDGTLFLDEIGDLPLPLQAKLLRVLDRGEFEPVGATKTRTSNARIVAATSIDLVQAVTQGRFRADLYYRLSVFPIRLAPVRERRGDLLLLMGHFVEQAARKLGRPSPEIDPTCLSSLEVYSWPGNVREIRNAVERAVLMTRGSVVTVKITEAATGEDRQRSDELIPAVSENGKPLSLADSLHRAKAYAVKRALAYTKGNAGAAAQLLGIAAPSLSRLIKRLGLSNARQLGLQASVNGGSNGNAAARRKTLPGAPTEIRTAPERTATQ